MQEFIFISYHEENDGVSDVNNNVIASIEWLKTLMDADKDIIFPGRDSYRAMVEWLKINHPEKLL